MQIILKIEKRKGKSTYNLTIYVSILNYVLYLEITILSTVGSLDLLVLRPWIQPWIENTWKKNSRKFQKAKLEFVAHRQLFTQHLHQVYNYLHSIYLVLGIESNLETISSIQEDVCKLYANTTHFISASLDFGIHGGPGTNPLQILSNNCMWFCSQWQTLASSLSNLLPTLHRHSDSISQPLLQVGMAL